MSFCREWGWACRPTHRDERHIIEVLLKTKELVSDVRRSPVLQGEGPPHWVFPYRPRQLPRSFGPKEPGLCMT